MSLHFLFERCFSFSNIRCDPVLTDRYTTVIRFEMPENSHHYNVCPLFFQFLKLLIVLGRTLTRTLNLRKNGPLGKTGPHGLKTLPFFSSHMNENVEVIHFHINNRGVQGLVFV